MNREPLSNADFALLRLDSSTNWMIVTALITLESRLDSTRLKRVLEHSMLRQPRFRQRIVQSRTLLGRAYWEDDASFSIDQHIHCLHTPLPADTGLLEQLVSRLMSVGMDFSHPLWQVYLVEQYGSGSALVMRIHHSIADGISLAKMLLAMTTANPDESPGKLPAGPAKINAPPAQAPNQRKSSWEGKPPGAMQMQDRLAGMGKRVLSYTNLLDDALRLGGSTVDALGQLLVSPPDSKNTFRGQMGSPKKAAWTPGIPLPQVKFISKAFGVSVNDVLLSVVVGALYRYMKSVNEDEIPAELHSFVPVDLRRDARRSYAQFLLGETFDQPMGNRFGFAVLELPVGVEEPVKRLALIHQNMDTLKASGEALVSYWVLNLMGAVPGEIQNIAARFWLTKGSAIMTNVIGPPHRLYLGDAAIDTCIAWVPQSGPVGLGISIFSYNGVIVLGVATDQGLIPEPHRIVDFILAEYQLLWDQAQQSPQTAPDQSLTGG